MAGLTYQSGENYIGFSNGEQTKYVEFIHGSLLRIYTEKNSVLQLNNYERIEIFKRKTKRYILFRLL